ncbi:MAG: exo-alpha-sialidase, partial [Candidatus Latescibacteria bacterium]|nr:exo-alpha-sialidase [Candidatus Latescibacterota bacterium]
GGATWGEDVVLREDGGNQDIGYPRTVLRADGSIVTAYYYNDAAEGDRYIGATIWKP